MAGSRTNRLPAGATRHEHTCGGRGELVQWDTSEHDWLEGRGQKLYLIGMIDDASSELLARFVRHDCSEENRRLLKTYGEKNGRPVAFYTDRASLFVNTPKNSAGEDPKTLPPTQSGGPHGKAALTASVTANGCALPTVKAEARPQLPAQQGGIGECSNTKPSDEEARGSCASAACFGASPVASALGMESRRDPALHSQHFTIASLATRPRPDISTWR